MCVPTATARTQSEVTLLCETQAVFLVQQIPPQAGMRHAALDKGCFAVRDARVNKFQKACDLLVPYVSLHALRGLL